jgi:hypothetical protein
LPNPRSLDAVYALTRLLATLLDAGRALDNQPIHQFARRLALAPRS